MIPIPPGTALGVAVLYFIGKSLTKPQSKARLALICGLGAMAITLLALGAWNLFELVTR